MTERLLFILKHRESTWDSYPHSLSSGLLNSVTFAVAMLNSFGIAAKLAEVPDNNAIDREVTAYQPTHVVIEALWVVPEKFDVLMKLHPSIHWIVRNHSELPFLANEGIAFEWLAAYAQRGIEIMSNSPRAVADVTAYLRGCHLNGLLSTSGPNVYPVADSGPLTPKAAGASLDIGCFGAVRPLKNQAMQAVAAIALGQEMRKPVRFHLNSKRMEGGGEPIVKNLRALFAAAKTATLVEHDWMPWPAFRALVATMDLVAQVSFSETFNIVAADAVTMGVPMVCSSEVPFLGAYAQADPTSVASIMAAMQAALSANPVVRLAQQRRDLAAYVQASEKMWVGRFGPGIVSP